MNTDVLLAEKRLLNRNKWAYSLGGIGRDMVYQLVATFLITYVQFSGLGLTAAQFATIGVLLVVGRIWDAVNDPFMGSIVENTHSRWGKFRPWILLGSVLAGIAIIFMFTIRPSGWWYVVFFFVIYLFWEAFFTLNDIPYWSLIPALSKNKKDRDTITTMVVVFAGVGAFAGNAIISFTTVGNMVKGYAIIAVTFVIFFIACSCLTAFGVKEPPEDMSKVKEKVTLKQMFKVIAKNEQLLWSALALLFYSIGSNLLVALGYNFFWLEIGYDPSQTMIFIVSFAISNIGIQSLYSTLAKRFTRKQLMTFSFISLAFGYLVMLSLGWFPGFLPVNLLTACIFGFFIFGGQAIFYMVIIVNMTNTIEYNEYKTGDRNEAIVFSLRPFIAKLSSALEMLIVTLVLVVSGVYAMSQNVSELESQKSMFEEMTEAEQIELIDSIAITDTDGLINVGIIPAITYNQYLTLSATDQTTYINSIKAKVVTFANLDTESADKQEIFINLYYAIQDPDNEVYTYYTDSVNSANSGWTMNVNTAADSVFHDRVAEETAPRVLLRIAITILPVILILISMLIVNKKFIITEAYYEMITAETKKRQDAEASAALTTPIEA